MFPGRKLRPRKRALRAYPQAVRERAGAAAEPQPTPTRKKFFRAGPKTPLLPRLREKFPFELATRKPEAARFDLAGNQSAESIPPRVQGMARPASCTPYCSPADVKFFRNPHRRGRVKSELGLYPKPGGVPLEWFYNNSPGHAGARTRQHPRRQRRRVLFFTLTSAGAAPGRGAAARRGKDPAGARARHRPARRATAGGGPPFRPGGNVSNLDTAAGAISCPGQRSERGPGPAGGQGGPVHGRGAAGDPRGQEPGPLPRSQKVFPSGSTDPVAPSSARKIPRFE